MNVIPKLTGTVLLCVIACLRTMGADWPTYAHDNRRSAVTLETLVPPLQLQWQHVSPAPPAPGWSLPVNGYGAIKTKSNVSFDDSHAAIAVGDTVYFSSSAENRVLAVEAATGTVRWTHFTDAAPRLAPTYWKGKVYFGADDGKVRCLDARSGEVIWTFNAAPADEQMLGYGRFQSVWPIRAGVMIENGVAYFTAGLFPSEGAYLFAADPETGRVRWRQNVAKPGRPDFASLAPQGYPLAHEGALYLTSRISPTRFSLADGSHLPFSTPFPVVPRSHEYRFYNGGDYAQIWNGGQIVFGRACLLGYDPEATWTNRYRRVEQGKLVFNWFNARQTVQTGATAWFATDDHLIAVDRSRLPELSRTECLEFEKLYKQYRVADRIDTMRKYERIIDRDGKDHPLAVRLRQTKLRYSEGSWKQWQQKSPALFEKFARKCRWMLPLQATESLVLGGTVLYAGGDESVHAIDAMSGKLLWTENTGSRVRGLAIANGRLIVSTVDGNVRCYAKASPPTGLTAKKAGTERTPFAEDKRMAEARRLADTISGLHELQHGHALILGGDGRLAHELVERTGLTIQLWVAEDASLEAIRRQLATTGKHGHRINNRQGDAEKLPYAPYLFNLVVDRTRTTSSERVSELFRVTRPLGGITFCTGPNGAALSAVRQSGAKFSSTNGWTVIRRGALPGARDWTHNYASPANTYSSEDMRVKGPFGILWYGEPGPRQRIDRHATAPMPLVANGILFTIGYDRVMAYDVYNGTKYWERVIPGATRQKLPLATSNIAADDSGLFIVVENGECLHLNATDGRTLRRFYPPPRDDDSKACWGWIAREGRWLFGTRALADSRGRPDPKHSDEVFVIDVATGKPGWRHRLGKVEHDGIAIGDGTLYLLDQKLTEEEKQAAAKTVPPADESVPSRKPIDRRGRPIEPDLRKLVAIDIATGNPRWEVPFDASDITLDDHAVLEGRTGVASMVKDGMVVVHGTGSLGHPHRQFLSGEFARRALYVFSAKDGRFRWGGRKGYRKRPIIAGDHIYAEPFAWHLQTGKLKTISNPLSGEQQPFDFHRGYIGCSHLLASGATLFGNKDGIGYCNLDSREGFSSFKGLSLACGLNAAPANGVFVAPEGRSGCTCSASAIHTSVTLYPRTFTRDWAGGVAGGMAPVRSLPVRHAYINLGAPGYREDPDGRLWIPYPAPREDGFVGNWIPRYRHTKSMFYQFSPDVVQVDKHRLPWLFTSGYRDSKPLSFKLQEKDAPEANYKITLHFADLAADSGPGRRVFDVLLQNQTVLSDFDVYREAGASRRAVTKVFRNVRVAETLTIALRPAKSSPSSWPVLSAIAIEAE